VDENQSKRTREISSVNKFPEVTEVLHFNRLAVGTTTLLRKKSQKIQCDVRISTELVEACQYLLLQL